MSTAHITIAGVPLTVDYTQNDNHAAIFRVYSDGALDDIQQLLSADVLNSIRIACVKHAREEADFQRRCEEQERLEA